MALAAVAVSIIATLVLYSSASHWIPGALGDTDDATRMVMVRELLAGRGWWDQHFLRYQPPVGVYMHWSRLLDGGIAALNLFFQLFLAPRNAEIATRIVWPALWIIPAVWASLSASRSLAIGVGMKDDGRSAVLAALLVTAISMPLYTQFHPGRIDHHNAQIALTLIALAGVMKADGGRRPAIIAGVAAGLCSAVGLEALLFQVLLAGVCALRFFYNPKDRPFVEAYALALLGSTVLAYGVQTPPWRWTVMACDAIGANLVGAVAAGSLGLVVAMRLTAEKSWPVRLAALATAGGLCLAAFFGLYPNCVRGPFADVDDRIRGFWLDHVSEVANLALHYKRDPEQALSMGFSCLLGGLTLLGVGLYARRFRSAAWWALSLSILLGLAVGWSAIRMTSYGAWFAVPAVAVASAFVATRYQKEIGLLAPLGAAIVLAPVGWGGLAIKLDAALKAQHNSAHNVAVAPVKPGAPSAPAPAKPAEKKKDPPDYCFNAFAYKDLANAPKGLTLSEIDLGPFVVAYTPSSTLSAPYHRLSWGILAARDVLSANVDQALPMARKLGVTYVLECPRHVNHADRSKLPKDALQTRLDNNDPPAWLQRMSNPKSPVVVYRIVDPPKTQ